MACIDSQTTLRATIPVPAAQLVGGTVTVCRVFGCATSAAIAPGGETLEVQFAPDELLGATGTVTPGLGNASIEISFPVVPDARRNDVPEMETYRLEVVDAEGTTVFVSAQVAPARSYANGRECDGEDFCMGRLVQM
jgi:hypothetical protein